MKNAQVQEPKRTISSIVLGDGTVMGDPLPIKSITLDGVEHEAEGVTTVMQNPLPDWVEFLRVGDIAVTNANKERTIKYIVLGDGTKIG